MIGAARKPAMSDRKSPRTVPNDASAFVPSTTNLGATRDQIRQLIIDVAQLIRVAKDTTSGIGAVDVDDASTTAVERLDVTQFGFHFEPGFGVGHHILQQLARVGGRKGQDRQA